MTIHSIPGGAGPGDSLKLDKALLEQIQAMLKSFEKSGGEQPVSWFLGNIGKGGVFLAVAPSSFTSSLSQKDMDYVIQGIDENMGREIDAQKDEDVQPA